MGLVAPAEDVNGFTEIVKYFIEHYEVCTQKGLSGPEFYQKHFGKDKFIEILSEDMRRITR